MIARIKTDFEMKTQKNQEGFLQFFAEGRIFSDVSTFLLFFTGWFLTILCTGRQNRKVGPCVKKPVKSEFNELKKKNLTSLVEEPIIKYLVYQKIKLAKWLNVAISYMYLTRKIII